MHKACSHVDFMVHHCGSGTYSYQLMHQVPAIILGSRLYDRDEIAIRLNELGAACYLSADLEEGFFFFFFFFFFPTGVRGGRIGFVKPVIPLPFQKQGAILPSTQKARSPKPAGNSTLTTL